MSGVGREGPATNVLVVLTDQLRADCLGFSGNPDVRTPTLDALARDGVWYPDSYCTAPRCTPSRYSMLTGLYPRQHGVYHNNQSLEGHARTLPELAQDIGVRSTAVGKMHLSPTYLDVGFDTMVLAEQDGDGRMTDDYHRDLLAAGLLDGNDLLDQRSEFRQLTNAEYRSSFGAAPSDVPEAMHSTTWIADRAIEHIDHRWADGGQLMYLSFIKPHHPFDPPRPWCDRYDPEALRILPGWTDDVPAVDAAPGYFDNTVLTPEVLRTVMAAYYGTISHLDHHLGRVLERLRQVGAYDRTLIVFTADHGEYLGFHHLLLKWGPMYEPVMRVPLVVKYPGGACAGTVDRRLTSGVDLVPTALAALGLPADGLPGHALSDTGWTRDAVVAESGPEDVVVRGHGAKLLAAPDGDSYFDLDADPLELRPTPVPGPAGRRLRQVYEDFRQLDPAPAPGSRPRRELPDPHGARGAPRTPADFHRLLRSDHPWLASGEDRAAADPSQENR